MTKEDLLDYREKKNICQWEESLKIVMICKSSYVSLMIDKINAQLKKKPNYFQVSVHHGFKSIHRSY